MQHERRLHPRFTALVKTTGRVGNDVLPLVCSNLGPGGAYFSSRVALPSGARLQLSLRAPGHNGPLVELHAEVVWSAPQGASRPAGVAVRWLRAECTAGVVPLTALLRATLRIAHPVVVEHPATCTASFDFAQHAHLRVGAPPLPRASATPSALRTPAAAGDARRTDFVVPSETAADRQRGGRSQPFPQLRPISALHEPQTVASTRPAASVPAPVTSHEVTSPLPEPLGRPPHRTEPFAVTGLRPPDQAQPAPLPIPELVPVPRVLTPPVSGPAPTPPPRRRASGTMRAEVTPRSRSSSSDVAVPALALVPAPTSDEVRSWPHGVPRVLAERYCDLTLLGQGGHGVVFRARDLLLERLVVLKFLAGTGMAPEQARRYFLREFKVAADLLHPNIVRLYDIGNADGTLYYTMEHVPGQTLRHYLGADRQIDDWRFVQSVFAQLAAALDHAHGHGVLHRDVKPSNVLVADDGTVRLFDFGLARLLDDGGRDQSMVVGTPYYMAPEMQKTAPIDHRADQYALGILLFRMLTGRVPFAEGNVFLAHATSPVPDPRRLRANLPGGVVAVLTRMLAKEPTARYPSCAIAAAELAAALLPDAARA